MRKLTGQCLCGEIAYEINGELGPIVNCHCSLCRRWHGAAFRSRCTVSSRDFKWIKGEEFLSIYPLSETTIYTFCSKCGSNLIALYKDKPDYIGLPIAGLEQDPGNKPIAHIHVASKAPWYEITDDLPQYDDEPPKESGL